MSLYQVKAQNTKVSVKFVEAFVNVLSVGVRFRKDLLKKHGITLENEWVPLEAWLKVFEDIHKQLGKATLFILGKSVFNHFEITSNVRTLKSGLEALKNLYNSLHEGDAGTLELIKFNAEEREAIIEGKTPYPSDFERGILTELARHFAPDDAIEVEVEIDDTKPTKENGAESTFYIIRW